METCESQNYRYTIEQEKNKAFMQCRADNLITYQLIVDVFATHQNCSGAPLPQESTGLGQVGRPEGGDPQTPKYLSYPGLEQEFPVR